MFIQSSLALTPKRIDIFSLEKYKVLKELNAKARAIYESKDEKKMAELGKEREELKINRVTRSTYSKSWRCE